MRSFRFRFRSSSVNDTLDKATAILHEAAFTSPGLTFSRHFCGGQDSRMWFEIHLGPVLERVAVDLSEPSLVVESAVKRAILVVLLKHPNPLAWQAGPVAVA
jgi:hypothetical protein